MSKLSQLIGNLNERPVKIIEIPGRSGVQVGLWCLTMDEEEQACKRAYRFVQNDLKYNAIDLEYDENQVITNAKACEILSVALREPERPLAPFSENAIEIRQKLQSSEIAALFAEYIVFVKERSVLKDVKNPEAELDELIQLVAQNFPVAKRLTHYGSPSLRDLLLTALDRFVSGMRQSLSDGALPSASADSSTPG